MRGSALVFLLAFACWLSPGGLRQIAAAADRDVTGQAADCGRHGRPCVARNPNRPYGANPIRGITSARHHMSISGRCGPTRGFINIKVITIIMDIIPIRIGAPPIIIAFMNFTGIRRFIDSGLVAASRLRSNFFR